jgi:hypothetical protein
MADITSDGKTRVYWVTSIANINAPTTTELNAGIDLTSTLTADGLSGFQPTPPTSTRARWRRRSRPTSTAGRASRTRS